MCWGMFAPGQSSLPISHLMQFYGHQRVREEMLPQIFVEILLIGWSDIWMHVNTRKEPMQYIGEIMGIKQNKTRISIVKIAF